MSHKKYESKEFINATFEIIKENYTEPTGLIGCTG